MRASTGSTAKVAIITALITAAATISTAVISILPQLRQAQDYKKQLDTLKAAQGRYKIVGQVVANKNNAPYSDAEIYVTSADDSQMLVDNGSFLFQNKSKKPYLVVLAGPGGSVQRFFIDPENPKTSSEDLTITSEFVLEETP